MIGMTEDLQSVDSLNFDRDVECSRVKTSLLRCVAARRQSLFHATLVARQTTEPNKTNIFSRETQNLFPFCNGDRY